MPTDIIPRLLEAQEGSRELDALIHGLVADISKLAVPRYTTSLDAARTLMPPLFAWSVESSRSAPGHAWLYPPDNIDDIDFQGEAATPELALCIAALRARGMEVDRG